MDGRVSGVVDLSREFGTKELRETKVAEMVRKYSHGLSVDAFFELRSLVEAAYDSGERNGRLCLLVNQANEQQRDHAADSKVEVNRGSLRGMEVTAESVTFTVRAGQDVHIRTVR